MILHVARGVVTARTELGAVGAMGMAGPYRLGEPLLGDLSGGGFPQVIAASDLDGRPLVAKVPHQIGGGEGTGVWAGDRPVHVPASAFMRNAGEWMHSPIPQELTIAVFRAENHILDRDGGVLLPASLGVWEHEPSGLPVLVMERLNGRCAERAFDVRAVLAAVASAVDRGSFDAHGDLKHEHVFIQADGGSAPVIRPHASPTSRRRSGPVDEARRRRCWTSRPSGTRPPSTLPSIASWSQQSTSCWGWGSSRKGKRQSCTHRARSLLTMGSGRGTPSRGGAQRGLALLYGSDMSAIMAECVARMFQWHNSALRASPAVAVPPGHVPT